MPEERRRRSRSRTRGVRPSTRTTQESTLAALELEVRELRSQVERFDQLHIDQAIAFATLYHLLDTERLRISSIAENVEDIILKQKEAVILLSSRLLHQGYITRATNNEIIQLLLSD